MVLQVSQKENLEVPGSTRSTPGKDAFITFIRVLLSHLCADSLCCDQQLFLLISNEQVCKSLLMFISQLGFEWKSSSYPTTLASSTDI